MRSDRYYIQFPYVGQLCTCRLCGQTNHLTSACHTIICFNCEKTGHLASDCPSPTYGNTCKWLTHRARLYPLSWSHILDFPAASFESTPMNTENTETTENTTNPVSDHSENVTTENTVSDLPDADLSSMNSTPTNDAGESTLVDLDNTAEDHIDQDSSNSTLQDATYSSATEEQTMELFPETPSSRPSANGCKPTKISQAFTSPGKPTVPTLITGKPSCEHSPDSDDSPAPKNRTLAVLTNKNMVRNGTDLFLTLIQAFTTGHCFNLSPLFLRSLLLACLFATF